MTGNLLTCTRCGAELLADAAGGLCPRCLMAMNFDTRTMPTGKGLPSMTPLTPEELAEKFPQYEILECLGRGGMGVVYKARQKALDRVVAIKLLAGEWQGDSGFAARFEREAKTLAQMSHTNIVTVHDFGEAGGLFYIVMEFVDGVNLRDLLREGKMEPEQALAIVPPVCEALEYAHSKGVVHRDIKPENVLLDRDGRVKIADFGIASLVGAECERSGTPPYMAPEQERGSVDRRADIYALGVVLYEMLTGERPTKDIVAPSRKIQVDVKIDEMVLRALEKDPERRYQTAGEFRTVVETLQSAPISALPHALPNTSRPRSMFQRWWWVFLVMITLGLALGLAAGMALNYLVPKKYEADASFAIRIPDAQAAGQGFLAKQFEVLKSREAMREVAERLSLNHRWVMDDEAVMKTLRGVITTDITRGTDIMNVRVQHTSPSETVAIADAVVQVYREHSPYEIVVLEEAREPRQPVSPNIMLNLAIGGFAGLLMSPFLALLLMAVLQKLVPERSIHDVAATRPSGSLVTKKKKFVGRMILLCLAAFVYYFTVRHPSVEPISRSETLDVKPLESASDRVVELTLPSISGDVHQLQCLDFESDRFHIPPAAVADELLSAVNAAQSNKVFRGSDRLFEWLRETGSDVVAATYGSGAELWFLDQSDVGGQSFPLNGTLAAIDPLETDFSTSGSLAKAPFLRMQRAGYLGWPRLPKQQFIPFLSREGNRGVFQVVGVTDSSPRCVKIRYKLKHAATTATTHRLRHAR